MPVAKQGSRVRLVGLQNAAHMNDFRGVVEQKLREGRMAVKVELKDGETKTLKIKPTNMEVVCTSCGSSCVDLKVCYRRHHDHHDDEHHDHDHHRQMAPPRPLGATTPPTTYRHHRHPHCRSAQSVARPPFATPRA